MPYMLQLLVAFQKPDGKWAASVRHEKKIDHHDPCAMRGIVLRTNGKLALLSEHTHHDSGDIVAQDLQAQQAIEDVVARLERRGGH